LTATAHRNGKVEATSHLPRPQPQGPWARAFLGLASVLAEPHKWFTSDGMDEANPADVLAVARKADERLARLGMSHAAASNLVGAAVVEFA
jgi:hypothetical protein